MTHRALITQMLGALAPMESPRDDTAIQRAIIAANDYLAAPEQVEPAKAEAIQEVLRHVIRGDFSTDVPENLTLALKAKAELYTLTHPAPQAKSEPLDPHAKLVDELLAETQPKAPEQHSKFGGAEMQQMILQRLVERDVTPKAEPVNKQLLEALNGLLRIHTEPAGYEGKAGKEFDHFLELQIQKCNSAIENAKAAIAVSKE